MARTSLTNTMLSSGSIVGLALLVVVAGEPIAISICPRDALRNETVQIPHEYDCTKYYTCLGSKNKVLRECPLMDGEGNRLHFNTKLQVCDWPWSAECESLRTLKATGKMLFEEKSIPTRCPRVDSKYETVHLAHESDCTKFYKCQQGKRIPMSCPLDNEGNRLYFNPSVQVCDWPYNVDCQHRELTLRMQLADKPIPTRCPRVDSPNETVHLAHEYDCTKFYKCHQGRKILMSCPTDKDGNKLYFNPSEQVCDWPFNVNCQQPELTLKKESVARPIPTKCPKQDPLNETILLAHERDCTKFYICSNGRKILQQCPELDDEGNRLYFNPEEQSCDWPWNVDCKLPEPIMTPGPIGKILPVPTECPAKDPVEYEVHLAHESDCTLFYKCFRGIKYLLQCPKIGCTENRYFFNKYSQECDLPWKADCDLEDSPATTRSTTTRRPSTTSARPTEEDSPS